MKRYPKLRYPGDEETAGLFRDGRVFIQEKLDGANFRFTLEDNLEEQFHTEDREIAFGSRNVVFKNAKDENKQFADAMEYVRENVDPDKIRYLESDYGPMVFFAEAMMPHTIQEYRFDEIPDVIGFDVWLLDKELFLDPETANQVFEEIGLEVAPVIDVIDAEEWDDYDFEVPESNFGPVKAEGVVFKNPDTETRGKFVREDFKEKNNKTFGKPKKYQETGAEKLSYRYIANPRIKKCAHKLVDEGDWDSLKMEMMEDLPEKVIRDMASEEAGTVFMEESWEVDIAEFRSVTSSRCATVLKKMINEQIREEL